MKETFVLKGETRVNMDFNNELLLDGIAQSKVRSCLCVTFAFYFLLSPISLYVSLRECVLCECRRSV